MSTATHRHPAVYPVSSPSTPRLRLEPTGSRRTLLDGGWWPRSADPVAELPGLILTIDNIRGPVTRLVLSSAGWSEHPRRLGVNDRVLRLGYFTSQSTFLLTAICGYNGERVDLLVVPPETRAETAHAAMALAASTANRLQAHDILTVAGTALAYDGPEDAWETDGGRLPAQKRPAQPDLTRPSPPPAQLGRNGDSSAGAPPGRSAAADGRTTGK